MLNDVYHCDPVDVIELLPVVRVPTTGEFEVVTASVPAIVIAEVKA